MRPRTDVDHSLHLAVSRALAVGLGLALAGMAFGVAIAIATGGAVARQATPLPRLLHDAARLDPTACMSLGIALLLATPALRVLVLLIGYLRRRDWLFAGLAATVLAILAASLRLGITH